MKRRVFLAQTAGFTALIAGCTQERFGLKWRADANTDGVEIDSFTATNHHIEPHGLEVLITEGDDIVYWNSKEVTAWDPDPDSVSGAIFKNHPIERGEYVVSARLTDWPPGKWEQADFTDEQVSCIEIQLSIGSQGNHNEDNIVILAKGCGSGVGIDM